MVVSKTTTATTKNEKKDDEEEQEEKHFCNQNRFTWALNIYNSRLMRFVAVIATILWNGKYFHVQAFQN